MDIPVEIIQHKINVRLVYLNDKFRNFKSFSYQNMSSDRSLVPLGAVLSAPRPRGAELRKVRNSLTNVDREFPGGDDEAVQRISATFPKGLCVCTLSILITYTGRFATGNWFQLYRQ